MNPTHVVATGGTTAMLAQVLVWATHWPLQALDANTALALAGLLVAGVGGGGLAWLRRPGKPEAPQQQGESGT